MRTRIRRAVLAVSAIAFAATLSMTILVPTAGAATATPTGVLTRLAIGSSAGPNNCSSGYLCAFVPTAPNGWYEFKFYYCQRYYLTNFFDDTSAGINSPVIDDQSSGTTTTYYGASGNVLQTMRPSANKFQDVMFNKGGWNPVYSIKVC